MNDINNPSIYHNYTFSLRIYQQIKKLLKQVNKNNFDYKDYDFKVSSNLIVFLEGNIGAGNFFLKKNYTSFTSII